MMKRLLSYIFILLVGLSSCKKEEDPRDPVPRIEIISIQPSIIKEYQDSVLIVVEYYDGDGDLGGVGADDYNMFAIDRRIDIPFEFRIKELVPGGVAVPVSGRMNLVIRNLFITDGSTQQQVDFEVYAVDKAGNESNKEITSKVLITKD